MKISYASDLHLEFNSYLEIHNTNQSDVLILAGDIIPINIFEMAFISQNCIYNNYGYVIDFFKIVSKEFKHVIYVAGNHEFYKSDINDIVKLKLMLKKFKNIHVLDNESIVIEDNLFIGGTCWTNINDPELINAAIEKFNDYKYISNFNKLLSPSDTILKYETFIEYLTETIKAKTVNGKTIVITHHCPSKQGIPDKYKNNFWNDLFTNDLDEYIADSGIDYFVYGHTHDFPRVYEINKTTVMSNVYGYPTEEFGDDFSLMWFEV